MNFNVYAIGNAIIDIQTQAKDADLEKLQIDKPSMNLVDSGRQRNILEYFNVNETNYISGGSAANTAIILSQLGAKTCFSAKVGNDSRGKFYVSELKEHGVNVHIGVMENEMTGTSIILITPDAERSMNTCLGASFHFNIQDINENALKSSEWLYIEGYLLTSKQSLEAVFKAVEIAKANGVKIALTLSDKFVVEIAREFVNKIIEECDLIFANYIEAIALVKGEALSEEQILDHVSNMAKNAIITNGEKGVWYNYNGQYEYVPAYVVNAVDDTGAGDAFAGGFLYGIIKGKGPSYSSKLGCYFASKVVSQYGARLAEGTEKFYRQFVETESE